jgi:hypothetical protein
MEQLCHLSRLVKCDLSLHHKCLLATQIKPEIQFLTKQSILINQYDRCDIYLHIRQMSGFASNRNDDGQRIIIIIINT